MKIREKEYAQIIVQAALQEIDPKKLAPELWQSLYATKSLSKVARIFSLAEKIMAEKNNRLLVSVVSATELSDNDIENISLELKQRYNKEIEAEFIVDPALGSGLKITAGDRTLDYSSSNQINNLVNFLKKS